MSDPERPRPCSGVLEIDSCLLDVITELCAYYDTELRVLWVNRASYERFGQPRERLLTYHCYELWQRRDAPCPVCPVLEAKASGRPQQAELTDLEERVWWVCGYPVRDAAGNLTGLMETAQDITDLKRAEAERLEMERRLLQTQKMESLGVMAGGIAHDYNNLLTVILGNLELARQEMGPNAVARLRIESAMQAAQRAADLARQMLAYSGKGHFVIKQLDLSDLIEQNLRSFRASIPATIVLNLNLGRGLPRIAVDPNPVQQVLVNLLTNASEAIGDTPGIITLSSGQQECDEAYLSHSRLDEKPPAGRFVYLEVSDTGCGMDEDTQARLFDPFFSTKFTGRGLGMSAVLGIVRGHRGAIMVDSQPGRGTTVRVLFPALEAPAGAEAAETRLAVAPWPGAVLVIDDEELVRELCQDMLAELGLRALVAADGEQAVALLQAHADDIQCVLLDLAMPRLDGMATLKALRRIRPDLKVVMLSGYSELEITRRFPEAELDGFIQKPFKLQTLQDVLERVLGVPCTGPLLPAGR